MLLDTILISSFNRNLGALIKGYRGRQMLSQIPYPS